MSIRSKQHNCCPPREKCLQIPASALEHFDEIAARVQGKELALFLDYDGTLTPIVERPEKATLSGEMRWLLKELAQRSTLAIVSGRDRRDAEGMVQLEGLAYAGSHGFDIRGPGGLEMQHEDAQRALPELDQAEQLLRQRIAPVKGAHVERKRFAIAMHYRRLSSQEAIGQAERAVNEILGRFPGLRKRDGKKIFELQPDVDWDKGQAVLWLTQALGLDHGGVAVIYIGDDLTDEDAFRALRDRHAGLGIRVGASPSQTQASYCLRDCSEVRDFLRTLLATLQKKKSHQ